MPSVGLIGHRLGWSVSGGRLGRGPHCKSPPRCSLKTRPPWLRSCLKNQSKILSTQAIISSRKQIRKKKKTNKQDKSPSCLRTRRKSRLLIHRFIHASHGGGDASPAPGIAFAGTASTHRAASPAPGAVFAGPAPSSTHQAGRCFLRWLCLLRPLHPAWSFLPRLHRQC